MAAYGYSFVTDKAFSAFARDLEQGAWKGVSVDKYDVPNRVPAASLFEAPRPVVWKLRARWSIAALDEALGVASAAALAELDTEWDTAQRALHLFLASAAESKDPAQRDAAVRLRGALLAGAGTERIQYAYDAEVDYGWHQVAVAAKAPLAADVKKVGAGAYLKRIEEATEALARGSGAPPARSAPSRARSASGRRWSRARRRSTPSTASSAGSSSTRRAASSATCSRRSTRRSSPSSSGARSARRPLPRRRRTPPRKTSPRKTPRSPRRRRARPNEHLPAEERGRPPALRSPSLNPAGSPQPFPEPLPGLRSPSLNLCRASATLARTPAELSAALARTPAESPQPFPEPLPALRSPCPNPCRLSAALARTPAGSPQALPSPPPGDRQHVLPLLPSRLQRLPRTEPRLLATFCYPPPP